MKALLMHPDRDFDGDRPVPVNAATLSQDLELQSATDEQFGGLGHGGDPLERFGAELHDPVQLGCVVRVEDVGVAGRKGSVGLQTGRPGVAEQVRVDGIFEPRRRDESRVGVEDSLRQEAVDGEQRPLFEQLQTL